MTKKLLISLIVFMMIGTGCTDSQENAKEHPQSAEKENRKKNVPPDSEDKAKEKLESKQVKGIYLNRNSLKEENIDKYIKLIKSTDLNAVVLDVKDDFGKLTYDSNLPLANKIGADKNPAIKNAEKLLDRLKEENIYTIARIVVFKDPYLAEQKSDYAIKRKNGSVWEDQQGVKWIDPYKKEVWKYVTDVAKEVSSYGFDEIQYDYIRFPENAKQVEQEVTFDNQTKKSKDENILSFLKYSEERLKPNSVNVSADVFGLVTTAKDDMGIGQLWEKISPNVDTISPMTYPSHYAPNSYGINNPDQQPYDVMKHAMEDALQRNEDLEATGKDTAAIRPWIQDFDLKRNYTVKDVRNQIKALEDQGIQQYLVWNASNEYTDKAYN